MLDGASIKPTFVFGWTTFTQALAAMDVRPQRLAREGRSHYRIAFISDPDGNIIELMQIRPESALYRD